MNAIILGWFGEKNIGDDLILKSSLNILRKNSVIEDIYVSSNHKINGDFNWIYDHDFSFKSWIKLIIRGNIFKNIKAWIKSDLVVFSVGGGVSDWNKEVMTRLITKIKFYKKINKKIVFLGVGAGPFVGNYKPEVIADIFNKVDLFLVRDKTSFKSLNEIGIKDVLLTNDVVFEADFLETIKLNKESDEIVYIPVPLFYNNLWKDNKNRFKQYTETIKSSLLELSKNNKVTIIPFQKEFDKEYLLNYIDDIFESENIELLDYENYEEVYNRLQQCKVIINSRFHGLVLATIFNKPSISIIYDHKINDLITEIGTEETCLHVGDGINWNDNIFTVEELNSKIKYVLDNYEIIKEKNKKYNNKSKLNSEELKKIYV